MKNKINSLDKMTAGHGSKIWAEVQNKLKMLLGRDGASSGVITLL